MPAGAVGAPPKFDSLTVAIRWQDLARAARLAGRARIARAAYDAVVVPAAVSCAADVVDRPSLSPNEQRCAAHLPRAIFGTIALDDYAVDARCSAGQALVRLVVVIATVLAWAAALARAALDVARPARATGGIRASPAVRGPGSRAAGCSRASG